MTEEVEENEEHAEDAAPEVEVETRYGVPVTRSRDHEVLHPTREELLDTVSAMRDDGFVMLLDVTAVDYLEAPARDLPLGMAPERYEVVVGLISHANRERLRLRVQVPADEPTVPSLFDLYPGAEALERETFDMFGITFDGHPDMSRILMPDDWDGHPLRKDYALGRIPVQFKGAPGPR
ncbi:MAG: NADH-quinone oxidoreductase subunit C [Acidimicrobiia bacterium]